MAGSLLYLSSRDITSLAISPAQARNAILETFVDHANGRCWSPPKSAIDIAPGHAFQAMSAACSVRSVATSKWVAMVPTDPDSKRKGINGLIFINDFETGEPLAVLDGNEITLTRTAALSAAVASRIGPAASKVIGFVACGLQAQAHLDAFCDLYPSIERVIAFSRTRASAERLVEHALARGLEAETAPQPDGLIREADVIITSVSGNPEPFLDGRKTKSSVFVASIECGRSWMPESLTAFNVLVTDNIKQAAAPFGKDNRMVSSVKFDRDITQIAIDTCERSVSERVFFGSRGHGLADLALAELIFRKAKSAEVGTVLAR